VSENIIEASWQALTDSLIYKLKKDEEKSRDSGKKSGSRSKKKEKIYGSLY
jgi:2-isopropylmalate synthase